MKSPVKFQPPRIQALKEGPFARTDPSAKKNLKDSRTILSLPDDSQTVRKRSLLKQTRAADEFQTQLKSIQLVRNVHPEFCWNFK